MNQSNEVNLDGFSEAEILFSDRTLRIRASTPVETRRRAVSFEDAATIDKHGVSNKFAAGADVRGVRVQGRDRGRANGVHRERPSRVQSLRSLHREAVRNRAANRRMAAGFTLIDEVNAAEPIPAARPSLAKAPNALCRHYARAHAQYVARQWTDAAATLQSLLEQWPQFADAHVLHGLLQCAIGDPHGARTSFNRALRIDPLHPSALANRANLDRRAGDNPSAIDDASAAIAIDCRLAPAYATRGLAYLTLHEDALAQADFARCLSLDPRLRSAIEKEAALIRQQRGPDLRIVVRLFSRAEKMLVDRRMACKPSPANPAGDVDDRSAMETVVIKMAAAASDQPSPDTAIAVRRVPQRRKK